MSAGMGPERALKRRLSVRSFGSSGKTPAGKSPESATPGRRSSTTPVRFWSHLTPAQLQGVVEVAFQRRVLPPTAARTDNRAARSEVRSGLASGRRRRRKKK